MNSQLKLPCLGRPFSLGMLYDAHSECIIPGKSLWDSTVIKSATNKTPQPSSNFEIIAKDSIEKKSSSLNIEANLKLSLLGGMVDVSGAAKFLNDKQSSEQQARVTLKYSSTTHFEQLTMEQLGALQYPEVLDDHHATHIVTGIQYGSDAFFVFDRSLVANEKFRDVHGNLEAKIQSIPAIQGSASLDINEKETTEIVNLQCQFWGDLILNSNPSNFDEAVKVYKDLPQLLENKSVSKMVYLYPLSELNGKPQLIVRWINSDLIAKVENIMEGFQKVEMKCNDLLKHNICSKFSNIEDQISTLLNLLKRFQLKFSKNLASLLPKIRSLGAEEMELAELVSSIYESPFHPEQMEKYQTKKDREIQQLDQFLKNLAKLPKIQFAFSGGGVAECSLTALTTDDQIDRVVCFAFNVTSDTTPYIKNLERYLHSGTSKSVAQSEKEWYESRDLTKLLRQKSTQFSQFVEANNSVAKNVAFVVIDRNEETDSTGPTIIDYADGFPQTFEPPGKPKNLAVSNITHDSVDVTWEEPEQGADFIISYTVLYCSSSDELMLLSKSTKDKITKIHIGDLQPGLEYKFRVQAVSDPGNSIESDEFTIDTEKNKRLADEFLVKKNLVHSGPPCVYTLPLIMAHANAADGLYKYNIGSPNNAMPKPEKVLMVIGATGAGKSTLINGIANYVTGVNWKDKFRFKVIADEGSASQAESQTKTITAYTFYSLDRPYNLTVIDTPGFGDTGGIERDKYIASQIKKFFSGRDRGGIDQLHGIGFVTQSALARLTPPQKYIFDAVLSIFGKDIVDNIFLLVTFADAKDPPVLAAVKAAKIPFKKSFRFNNSALFASNTSTGMDFNSMFWDMGIASFEDFFDHFSEATARSLELTREVLKEREQLENLIPGLQQQVKVGLSQLDVIQQEENILKQHEADLAANKDFDYVVDVDKFKKIPQPNAVTTTCLFCSFTCHPSCAYSNDKDKIRCCAMRNGYCIVCPQKCHWEKHANLPYRVEYYTVKERRTHNDLKKRYDTAKTGKERVKEMVEKKETMLQNLQTTVFSLIEDVTKSIERLNNIALKPNPLTEIEYIDILIDSEKSEAKPGWKRRVKQYRKLREEAAMLKKIPNVKMQATSNSKDKSWWNFWSST